MMSYYHLPLFLGVLSYVFWSLSFLMRKMFPLRLLALASSTCAIFYFSFYLDEPLWLNIFWKLAFTFINLYQITSLIIERSQASFQDEEEELCYRENFSSLSIMEFRKIINVGAKISAPQGFCFTEENVKVKSLVLITKGIASVKVKDKIIAYCRRGNFIGEMSLITGLPATAAVEALDEVHGYQWNAESLKTFIGNHPELRKELQAIFNKDLVVKLLQSNLA